MPAISCIQGLVKKPDDVGEVRRLEALKDSFERSVGITDDIERPAWIILMLCVLSDPDTVSITSASQASFSPDSGQIRVLALILFDAIPLKQFRAGIDGLRIRHRNPYPLGQFEDRSHYGF
jgi:hypothetical protein